MSNIFYDQNIRLEQSQGRKHREKIYLLPSKLSLQLTQTSCTNLIQINSPKNNFPKHKTITAKQFKFKKYMKQQLMSIEKKFNPSNLIVAQGSNYRSNIQKQDQNLNLFEQNKQFQLSLQQLYANYHNQLTQKLESQLSRYNQIEKEIKYDKLEQIQENFIEKNEIYQKKVLIQKKQNEINQKNIFKKDYFNDKPRSAIEKNYERKDIRSAGKSDAFIAQSQIKIYNRNTTPQPQQQIQQKNTQKQNILNTIPDRNEIPNISSQSWALIDGVTGKYLFGKAANQQVEIASLTKMMTLLVVLKFMEKYKLNPQKIYVTISAVAASMSGTLALLCHKENVSILDLLYGLMLPSGNDAAIALSEAIGILLYFEEQDEIDKIKNSDIINIQIKKSFKNTTTTTSFLQQDYLTHEEKMKYFIKEMNKISGEIGLERTNFASVHGLMNYRNISTARDIGQLSYFIMKIELVRKIVKTKTYTANIISPEKNIRLQIWENTNKLLDKGYEGIKTGVTESAGPCLASSYRKQRGDKLVHLITVVLCSKSLQARFTDSKAICRWGEMRFYDIREEILDEQ